MEFSLCVCTGEKRKQQREGEVTEIEGMSEAIESR